MTLALTLFGSFRAHQANTPLAFATNAARALLAYLAVEAARPHPREHLAALLWPDVPQPAAFANLRQTLARLRKALPDSAPITLEVTPQTIHLKHEAVTVDVLQFEALLSACVAHTHADLAHCRECMARMQQATALYQGEFLHGLSLEHSQPFEEWLLFKREELHQRALGSLDTLAQHYKSIGEYEAMRRAAARQLALEPWHETAHLQLMLALAHLGQRAAALAQFQACRAALQNELGIEPGIEIVTLYERIQAGTERAEAFTSPGALAPRHNLPEQLTAFVGRERELAEAVAHVRNPAATERLLTLVGPGGMGKTRLALETAHICLAAFSDGAFFVSLAPLATSADIVPSIASALGLSVQGNDLKQALLSALHTRHLLLILDNFEHIIDGANLAADILQRAPNIKIIATSRERLNVRGERVFNVEGMAYSRELTLADAQTSAAVRLFVQSAHRAQPAFKLNEAALPAVLRICELVQGVPLGLELAAAWAESLSLNDIAAEIEASTDFLAFDWRDLPERQRSMRAVFQWSWNLLSDAERTIFQRLSVFRGGFTREAAQTVAGASLASLTRLVHKSLLRRADSGRYDLHELVRQFAAEQLQAAPDEHEQIEAHHAKYYIDRLVAREQRLTRREPRQAAAEIQAEMDNLRKAWVWETVHARLDGGAELDELDRSAFVLAQFYLHISQYSEGESAFSSAVKHLQSQLSQVGEENQNNLALRKGRVVLSKLLALNARFFAGAGKNDAALPLAQQAVELGRAVGGVGGVGGIEGEAMGCLVWGMALIRSGKYQAAQLQLERAVQLAQHNHTEDTPLESLYDVEGSAYIWMGVRWYRNDYAAARTHLIEALRVAQSRGNLRHELVCHLNLANCARGLNDYALAKQDYERALHMAHDLGYHWGEASALTELGDVVRMLGNYALAQQVNERALVMFRDMGDYVKEAYALNVLALLDILRGSYAQAQAGLEQIWHMIHETANPEAQVVGLMSQALLYQHTHQPVQALEHAEKAKHVAVENGERVQEANALTLVGHAYLSLNDLPKAASAYEQALSIFTEIGNTYQAVEPQAGLANIALKRGDLDLAQSCIAPILAVQRAHPRAGMDEPFFTYLVCYQVLLALKDPRAATVLEMACALLQDYAEHIDDDALRQSFLHNVPTHSELWALGISGANQVSEFVSPQRA